MLRTDIPAEILNKIIPIVTKQLKNLSNITSLLEGQLSTLQPSVKCDSHEVLQIKQHVADINATIVNLSQLIKTLNTISKTLNTIGNIATAVAAAQLLIPITPPAGFPGPIAKLLNITMILAAACKAAASVLKNILQLIDSEIMVVSDSVANAASILSNICVNDEPISVNNYTAIALDKKQIISNTGYKADSKSNTDIFNNLGNYTSKFYNPTNVSSDDLEELHQTIVDLLEQGYSDVKKLIVETPSDVIISNTDPLNEMGNEGDYYIDTVNQMLYGPKTNNIDNSWGIGIKY